MAATSIKAHRNTTRSTGREGSLPSRPPEGRGPRERAEEPRREGEEASILLLSFSLSYETTSRYIASFNFAQNG